MSVTRERVGERERIERDSVQLSISRKNGAREGDGDMHRRRETDRKLNLTLFCVPDFNDFLSLSTSMQLSRLMMDGQREGGRANALHMHTHTHTLTAKERMFASLSSPPLTLSLSSCSNRSVQQSVQ